ncbi:MAG: hypothetical protein ABIQ86_07340 [Steroidobacteraceae bacterium]
MSIKSLRELPQTATPARDLWPHIEARLPPRRRSWAVPTSLAAGVLLVAFGFIFDSRFRDSGTPVIAQQDPGALVRTALMSDPGYQIERNELLRTLPEKLEPLPPESQQRVRDSLLAVQTAMKAIDAELGRDSSNALLQELLISTHQEEMRVLTAVSDADGPKQEI